MMSGGIGTQTGAASGAGRHQPPKNPRRAMAVASVAPVLAFVLASAPFIAVVATLLDFGGSSLARAVSATGYPMLNYLTVAVLILLAPVLAGAVLVGPAVASALMNLKWPALTNWSRAGFAGLIFFLFYIVLLIALLVYRYTSFHVGLTIYDPLAYLGLLAGIALAGSVAIFGRLGARLRR
jgi:hypothetical protein